MDGARLLAAVLLILATGLVYLPSLGGGYVYDDHRFVRLNPSVQTGASFMSYFTDPATQTADDSWGGLYRPLRTLSFRVVERMSGGAAAQRIVSVLVHLLNGLLLFVLLRQLLGAASGLPPLLGALAFLLHPLATESVAWISGRGDLLAMAGVLGSLVLYLAPWRGARACSLIAFALALLSKESAVVLPLLLVVVDGFRFGLRGIRGRLLSYLPFVLVLAVYVVVRALVLKSGGFGQEGGLSLTPDGVLASVLAGEVYYLLATLFPWWLSFELDLHATAQLAVFGFFLLAALLLMAGALRNRARPVTLAILWFLVALIPVTFLQFLFPLKIEVANRFAYPALVAFGIVLAFASARRRPAAALALVVLVAFVPLSVARAGVWRSEPDLWGDVLRGQPGHGRALYGLGVAELEAGDPERARAHLLKAARKNPEDPKLAVYLGRACRELAAARPPDSPEYQQHLVESRSAYQAAVVSWARGAGTDRALFRSAALEAAWLSMLAGDHELAVKNARIMLEADGVLLVSDRTVRHLIELAHLFSQIRQPELSREFSRRAKEMHNRGSR